jgi:hypothetical protein
MWFNYSVSEQQRKTEQIFIIANNDTALRIHKIDQVCVWLELNDTID